MGIGEILYSMLTLLIMFLIIFSPLLKKMMKSVEDANKEVKLPPDDIYESVDSHRVVKRILNTDEQVKDIIFTEPETIRKMPEISSGDVQNKIRKIDSLSHLKSAVIWKEILDKPLGL
jgi:hypothetical protein